MLSATTKSFRNSAAFGKRIEYWIIGKMLKEGLDVYIPLVDDDAVDAIIKRHDGTTALIQIKARSKNVIEGDAALFAAIPHAEVRPNYWFDFYSERMDMTWIMTSEEFDREAIKNKSGKNVGLCPASTISSPRPAPGDLIVADQACEESGSTECGKIAKQASTKNIASTAGNSTSTHARMLGSHGWNLTHETPGGAYGRRIALSNHGNSGMSIQEPGNSWAAGNSSLCFHINVPIVRRRLDLVCLLKELCGVGPQEGWIR